MEQFRTFFLKTYYSIPAPIYGLLSAIIGISGDIISILLFDGYSLKHLISALGTGLGGIRI